mmetsp:Transcript_25070/g.78014  ORF Transcript_25070/g.78014 Transcript_25070/m.78014 type:complete len:204 (-) Transcript_25070:595-1206(-)
MLQRLTSMERDHVDGQVAGVPEAAEADPAVRCHHDLRDARVVAPQPQPCLWRQLQRPHGEIADHVHVAHDDLERVLWLRGGRVAGCASATLAWGRLRMEVLGDCLLLSLLLLALVVHVTVDVVPEACLDSGTVLPEVGGLCLVAAARRMRYRRHALRQQRVRGEQRHPGEVCADDVSCLHGSGDVADPDACVLDLYLAIVILL